ncbi:MAG: alkaline phosphatase family protein [Candidatus Andersenbacteria bacterium]
MPGYKRFAILLVDGLSPMALERHLDAGKLPNLARYVKSGSYHGNVVASFPTVTGPAHVPLFAGINPASIDLVAHNQYVRATGRFENYLAQYEKITEHLGDNKTLYHDFADSAAVGEPVRAGASTYRRNPFSLADWAAIQGPANWYVLRTVAAELRHGRDFVVGWLHETDAFAHVSRDESLIARSLQQLDRWLPRLEQELGPDGVLCLCSDHGMERTDGRPFYIPTELRRAGIHRGSSKCYLDGGAFAQIYLQKDASFKAKLDEADLGKLPAHAVSWDAVDLVLCRRTPRGEVAVVRSKDGVASCRRLPGATAGNTHYCYTVEEGSDPLRSAVDQPAAARFATGATATECLTLTGGRDYPDAAYQLTELLAAPSAGDLILTAAPGRTFNLLTRWGVHGGLRRSQSSTFLLFSKPVSGLDAPALRTAALPSIVRANRA